MAKFNIDKVKTEFDKLPIREQIEQYRAIGEWLHEKVKQQQEAARQLEEQLKNNG